MLKMDIEYKSEVLFVRLKGELNKKSSYKINNYLNPVIKKHNIKYLIYNWNDLKGVDNAGIDAILNSKCLIKANKGKIFVCHNNSIGKYLSKLFKVTAVRNELEACKLMEMI